MDVLRRSTDYALRVMVNLAKHYKGELVSAREVANEEDISYPVACKLLQKLHKAKLVESCMGSNGGFQLSRKPSKISLMEMIKAIQGPIRLNRCLLGLDVCPRQRDCATSKKLAELQECIDSHLRQITLGDLFRDKTRDLPKN